MRNVFKGFQASKMAIPKIHMDSINSGFKSTHAITAKRPALRMESGIKLPKKVKLPGKNPGTKF